MIIGRSTARRRRRAARDAPPGAIRDYLSTPEPEVGTGRAGLSLLAIDLETTGLDPRRDHILSVGFVPVDGAEVVLAGARHLVVRSDRQVGHSATIHALTDDMVAGGVPLESAMELTLVALAGRVLLAHHAVVETGFLQAATRALWGAALPVTVVDTLALQQRVVRRTGEEPREGSLRLWAARDHFGLPRYRAHNALVDALACAELYLAQSDRLAGSGSVTLGQLAS